VLGHRDQRTTYVGESPAATGSMSAVQITTLKASVTLRDHHRWSVDARRNAAAGTRRAMGRSLSASWREGSLATTSSLTGQEAQNEPC
jgi:hypothetical protein